MIREMDAFVAIRNVRACTDGLALICQLEDGRRFWVPRRLIGPDSQIYGVGDVGTLSVPQWFADEQMLPIAGH
jgi:hypothetical protein